MMMINPCLFLALAVATPAIAVAGPVGTEPALSGERSDSDRLRSLLIVRAEMEGGDAIAELLREDVLAALRAAKVAPTLPQGAPLELVVSADANTLGAYEVVYLHRGQRLDSWTCACSGEELRTRLQQVAPTMWQAAIAAATPVPVPAAVAPAPTAGPGPAMREPSESMGLAGIVITVVGTSVVAGNSAAMIFVATQDQAVTGLPVGLLATGVAITVTGGVLWGLANRTRKRAQLSLGAGRGVAFTLQGRF